MCSVWRSLGPSIGPGAEQPKEQPKGGQAQPTRETLEATITVALGPLCLARTLPPPPPANIDVPPGFLFQGSTNAEFFAKGGTKGTAARDLFLANTNGVAALLHTGADTIAEQQRRAQKDVSVNTERLWKGKVCAQASTSDLLKNFMPNGAATGTENLRWLRRRPRSCRRRRRRPPWPPSRRPRPARRRPRPARAG